MDKLLRGVCFNNKIAFSFLKTTDTVNEAIRIHNLAPPPAAALGRALTATAFMASGLKNATDALSVTIRGNGACGHIVTAANSNLELRGMIDNPTARLAPNEKGKLDVGGVVGIGFMNVIKDLGLKEPYVGQTVLQTGEIGDDLTYYFATSEQVPSSVGLGVLMEKDNTVKQAGGFIIQLMPFAEESVIAKLEENLSKVASVTSMLDAGNTPEQMLEIVLEGFDLEITDCMDTQFVCDCSKSKVEKALIAIGKKELKEMIEDDKEIEVNCHFCSKHYVFNVEELKTLYRKATR